MEHFTTLLFSFLCLCVVYLALDLVTWYGKIGKVGKVGKIGKIGKIGNHRAVMVPVPYKARQGETQDQARTRQDQQTKQDVQHNLSEAKKKNEKLKFLRLIGVG